MTDQTLTLHPIGQIRTSFANKVDAPRQPAAATGASGIIELFAGRNLEHALEDLAGWERIWVIFWFDRNTGWRPKVLPPRSTDGRKGVLSTRSPHRPNPLGLSVLRLARIEGLLLHVLDVDLLDGTPILDIKPYVPYTDAFPDSGSGWLAPGAADPGRHFNVGFSEEADSQLAWIAGRSPLALRERIVNTLMLGPQPHPYRRIKRGRDGGLTLAVQDWRIDFSVDDLQVNVLRIRSGYNPAQLASGAGEPDDPRMLHQAFVAAGLHRDG
ncbi:MAG: tRNA (N6-threonylcarbamoyladenosine(37)-N6)-methyltransferase TrmO [Gammaproteobacteria bacterium]|nr:tRNA (N6-threonylcarbamoyladenosine(37)-N6)-methyltransferase TrmO [Gammaproteobacteria bacterium]